MLYLCRVKPLRHYLRGFLIAAWAGDKIAEFSFPEISFHFPLRPWFFFVSPAYAGKSAWHQDAALHRRDHPRVCGEKVPTFQPPSGAVGITPAYAGKRRTIPRRRSAAPDHPRVCGEKPDSRNTLQLSPGSPPHVRGKALAYLSPCTERRITPAYAGKSAPSGEGAELA